MIRDYKFLSSGDTAKRFRGRAIFRRCCVRLVLSASVVVVLANFNKVSAQSEIILSEQGTNLGGTKSTGQVDDLRFTVDLAGDVPAGTYVWATVGSNEHRMRTNHGYWLPWNGDLKLLVDNKFPVTDGKITFKIMDTDIGIDNHGVSLRFGYRLGDILKFGLYALVPGAPSQ